MMKKGKWVEDKLQQLQKNPESYFLKGSKKPFVPIFEHSFEHFSSFRKGFSLLSYFLHPGARCYKPMWISNARTHLKCVKIYWILNVFFFKLTRHLKVFFKFTCSHRCSQIQSAYTCLYFKIQRTSTGKHELIEFNYTGDFKTTCIHKFVITSL